MPVHVSVHQNFGFITLKKVAPIDLKFDRVVGHHLGWIALKMLTVRVSDHPYFGFQTLT